MADLHAAIRERLETYPTAMPGAGLPTADRVNNWLGRVADALVAILDRHQPIPIGYGEDATHICDGCRYFTSEWPCPELVAVAEALGIEM